MALILFVENGLSGALLDEDLAQSRVKHFFDDVDDTAVDGVPELQSFRGRRIEPCRRGERRLKETMGSVGIVRTGMCEIGAIGQCARGRIRGCQEAHALDESRSREWGGIVGIDGGCVIFICERGCEELDWNVSSHLRCGARVFDAHIMSRY